MIDIKRENVVRSLAFLFTREELLQFRKTLAKTNDLRHAELYGLINDAELGDYRE